jgi:hypothetical protein
MMKENGYPSADAGVEVESGGGGGGARREREKRKGREGGVLERGSALIVTMLKSLVKES